MDEIFPLRGAYCLILLSAYIERRVLDFWAHPKNENLPNATKREKKSISFSLSFGNLLESNML